LFIYKPRRCRLGLHSNRSNCTWCMLGTKMSLCRFLRALRKGRGAQEPREDMMHYAAII
jgi:hypothetical protein